MNFNNNNNNDQAERNRLVWDNDVLRGQVAVLQRQLADAQGEIGHLQGLRTELENVRNENWRLVGENQRLQRQLAAAQGELDRRDPENRATIARHEEAVQHFNVRIDHLVAEKERLRQALDAAEAEATTWRNQAANLVQNNRELRDREETTFAGAFREREDAAIETSMRRASLMKELLLRHGRQHEE